MSGLWDVSGGIANTALTSVIIATFNMPPEILNIFEG